MWVRDGASACLGLGQREGKANVEAGDVLFSESKLPAQQADLHIALHSFACHFLAGLTFFKHCLALISRVSAYFLNTHSQPVWSPLAGPGQGH